MARTIQIGGLNRAAMELQEHAPLPFLAEELEITAQMTDALQMATTLRTGVAVCALAGAGKSLALQQSVAEFHQAEQGRHQVEPNYEPRRVVMLTTVRAETAIDFYRAVYSAAFGTLPEERAYRRRRTAEEVRDEIVGRMRAEQVCAVVVDEAQVLSPRAVEALRDLMVAVSVSASGGLEASAEGHCVRPAGLGCVLVGTMALYGSIQQLDEFGRRLTKMRVVGGALTLDSADLLEKLLPAFARGAAALGAEWKPLVDRYVPRDTAPPISLLADIARTYIYRAANENPTMTATDELPWDRDLFVQAIEEQASIAVRIEDAA